MATLFGKLGEHELELGRLEEEEEIEEKKSIALKGTSKKATKSLEPEVDLETKIHDKELMSMVVRKFNRFMKNKSSTTNYAGPVKGKKNSRTNVVQCYECGREGHIKPDCPYQKIKQKGSRKFPQEKGRKQKSAYIAWENSDYDFSSDEDCIIEEESNICFMVGLAQNDYDSN
ncbi:zinc finger CCHC-type and RNA-binding motif-containing protein 1-like [Vigna radiata var. radiata]|uniref:Zinc finger CCHC-type and RNA-binding motif-containing protein 1-like n=1 Tax=Vigna radiata var. radiata TaxID=3916 RepID=A0A3Q0ESR6_VIGRR|nr:zinc finger CCHC-type and RNA-binding motif-containing protein 1-like [Vigna radiata var. radiata]